MVLRHVYLTQQQDLFIRRLSGSDSEHIRRALDEYIERIKNSGVSVSPSQQKKGGNNG